jgi:hypothetical protein
MQVKPYGLLVYERTEWLQTPRKKDKNLITSTNRSKQNNADGTIKGYTGKLSAYSKKRLKKAIQLIVASSLPKEAPLFKTKGTYKFKVNFITLTLPSPQGNISDKEIKTRCLDPFIKRLKRKNNLKSYVWRAERQGNGNLHFHFITDCWIHYEKLRNDWNDCLRPLGFIDKFKEKNGHNNPNSTDIHSITRIKNLSQYFSKYMAKDEITQEAAMNIPYRSHKYKLLKKSSKKIYLKACKKEADCLIEGKVWDCSKNLKTKNTCEFLLETEALDTWNKCRLDPEIEYKNMLVATILFLRTDQFEYYVRGSIREKWLSYLSVIRGDS